MEREIHERVNQGGDDPNDGAEQEPAPGKIVAPLQPGGDAAADSAPDDQHPQAGPEVAPFNQRLEIILMRVLPKTRHPEGRELAAAKIMRSLIGRKDHGERAGSKTHQPGGRNHFEINFRRASARGTQSEAVHTPPTRLPPPEFGNDTEGGQRQCYQDRREQQSPGLKSVTSVPQGMPEDRHRQHQNDAEGDAPAGARGVQLDSRGQNEKRRHPETFPPGPA